MYGDTAAGRKRVAQLREQGGDVRALAARLVSQAEAVPWHGKAAEAMRERIRERVETGGRQRHPAHQPGSRHPARGTDDAAGEQLEDDDAGHLN